MNQLIKELKQLWEGLSKAIIILLKILVFIFTKFNLTHIPIIAKFLKLSHNTTGTLEQYLPKVDEKLKALRQENSKNTGSKSHYENWSIKHGNGWREEYSNKVGTTNYYRYLLKCTCCGHISEFNRKEFSRK